MNKISCDTCLDLIPLVKDDAASEDSKELVKDHMKDCQDCRELYNTFITDERMINDSDIISKIKRQIFIASIVTIVIASMLGLALSETMGMFYNILIMPTIGVIGYFALDKKSYYVSISLFVFSYVWLLIKYITEGMFGETPIITAITIPILWAGIYAVLCTLGVVIGYLLKYAFGKEKNHGI